MRVLICDDQDMVREGLRTILSTVPGMEVVALAENGARAVELFERHKPDLVLMDLNMPGVNGIQATRQIRQKHPEAKVLALTTYDADEWGRARPVGERVEQCRDRRALVLVGRNRAEYVSSILAKLGVRDRTQAAVNCAQARAGGRIGNQQASTLFVAGQLHPTFLQYGESGSTEKAA